MNFCDVGRSPDGAGKIVDLLQEEIQVKVATGDDDEPILMLAHDLELKLLAKLIELESGINFKQQGDPGGELWQVVVLTLLSCGLPVGCQFGGGAAERCAVCCAICPV